MSSKVGTESGQEYRKVFEAVRDYIFDRHKFPQVNDIVEATGIKKERCNEIVDQLVSQKELYVAFEGEGLPRIILLFDMMQGVLMTQKRPDWLANYGFAEKQKISEQISELQKQAIQFDQFERLLYSADIPLEAAIASTLDWLGFEEVIHHREDNDNPDVTFSRSGVKGLVEVEGTTKAGDKKKATQLVGWVMREIDSGRTADSLRSFFIVNHFRDIEPSKRPDPLTPHAKEFLRLSNSKFFTTKFLFDLVKDVSKGNISKEEATAKIWDGQPY